MIMIATCNPHGHGEALLCDEYYSWNLEHKESNGKIRGFVFWLNEGYCPCTYFVPVEAYYNSRDLPLQDALEAWIDFLFEQKSGWIVGGGYEGSDSMNQYAKENEDTDLSQLTWGASCYAIPIECWNCRETYIEADCINMQ